MKSYLQRIGSKNGPRYKPPLIEVFTIYSFSKLERTTGGWGSYIYGQTLKIPSANDERALWLQNCPYELRCVIVVLLNSLRSYVCYRIYGRMAVNVLKYGYNCIKKFE